MPSQLQVVEETVLPGENCQPIPSSGARQVAVSGNALDHTAIRSWDDKNQVGYKSVLKDVCWNVLLCIN